MRVWSGLYFVLASVWATAAAAAPRESPAPAGQTARLRIEVVQAGPVPRSLVLDLTLASEPSGPFNTLAEEGLTQVQKAALDHRNKVLTENTPDPDEYARVWAAFGQACDSEPNSVACARAKEGVNAFQAKLEAASQRAEAELASGPAADEDNHRFQKWGGDPSRGCGAVVSRVGGRTREFAFTGGQSLETEGLAVCSSELVLDRRTGRAFVKVNPLIYAMPGEKNGTFDLGALQRSAPNVKVEPGGYIGSPPHAILRELQVAGDLGAFTASGRLPPRTGAPLEVRIEFRRTD